MFYKIVISIQMPSFLSYLNKWSPTNLSRGKVKSNKHCKFDVNSLNQRHVEYDYLEIWDTITTNQQIHTNTNFLFNFVVLHQGVKSVVNNFLLWSESKYHFLWLKKRIMICSRQMLHEWITFRLSVCIKKKN